MSSGSGYSDHDKLLLMAMKVVVCQTRDLTEMNIPFFNMLKLLRKLMRTSSSWQDGRKGELSLMVPERTAQISLMGDVKKAEMAKGKTCPP